MLSQLATTSCQVNIKNLILITKPNHQIPNMVIETKSALNTIIIINYNNANIRHQKLLQSPITIIENYRTMVTTSTQFNGLKV